jgi:dynein light chain roadblock-type
MSTSVTDEQQDNVNLLLVEMQETVSRLTSHPGVQQVLILNRDGDILVESGSKQEAPDHANNTRQLLAAANAYIKNLNDNDEVSFLKIRSRDNYELMISPHAGYVLAVLKR